MSNILSIDKISKSFADKLLFEKISFGINKNEKVGLIGINGCGKSSLLKMIFGTQSPDEGRIVTSSEINISYLSQLPDFNPEHSISQHLFMNPDPVMKLIQEYEEICSNLSNLDISAAKKQQDEVRLNQLLDQIHEKNAFNYEQKIQSLLKELGIVNLQQKMKELSGGKLKKVALAQTLITPFGLLLLDEPTNHLDIATIIWLQKFLEKMDSALILITHDRYFLENVVSRIFEIDMGKFYKYDGAYSQFLEQRAQREELKQQQITKEKNYLRTELEWLNRQPKARGTKQKARIKSIQNVKDMQVDSRQSEISFSVSGRRLGKKILELKKVAKSFPGQLLFENFSYTFKHNERIGLIGPNGAGKSTLLEIMTGKILPDSGSVSCGLNTKFGYFDQNARSLKTNLRVLPYIKTEIGEWITTDNGKKITAREMLEMFHFDGRMQSSSVDRLSGGEKRRLQLVAVLMANPNFLILDEPTNDLDIDTLQRLEYFLESFGGCLFVVSHDRYFMDRVIDQLLVFDDHNTIQSHHGNFSDYLKNQKHDKSKKNKISNQQKNQETKKPKKASFKEKHEFSSLEIEIQNNEALKNKFETELGSAKLSHEKRIPLADDLQQLLNTLERQYARWEELAVKCG